ncbi:MAG: hypothetical protein WCG83_00705 [Candidatus Peregrinibacteria bacterium]
MKLKDIIGHEDIREALRLDLETGNVSHAYLFEGPIHLGKMTVAHQFAADLLTWGLSPEERKHVLHDCERLTHPDLLVLDQLWIEEKSENWERIGETSNAPQLHRSKKPTAKTDTISIEDIRALQELLYETPAGKFRVCIIRSIERMQEAAATTLLKILEEPPAPVVFLFTTASLQSLLPTIISRMRMLRFHPLPQSKLSPLLALTPEEDREFILHVAQGAPGIVQMLKGDPEALRNHRLLHTKALSFWRTSSIKDRLHILQPLTERGEASEELLLHLALALREHQEMSPVHAPAFAKLVAGLRTNAHRGLIAQRFAFEVQAK